MFDELRHYYPDCIIKNIDGVTEATITAAIGLNALIEENKCCDPVTFAACDNGALYNVADFNASLDDPETDILVWCVRGYQNAVRNPVMFGMRGQQYN